MSTGAGERVIRAQRWVEANRLALAVLLGMLWTGGMFLYLREVTVSLVCGAAFAGVLAATLPRRK